MSTESANRYRMGVDQIQKFLPHRAPFLLLDRILEIHPAGDTSKAYPGSEAIGSRVVARKNVTYNEPFFQGHFPGMAILPGVLIIEAMAQAASFTLYPYLEKDLERRAKDFQCILVGVDQTRFRRPVVPGDTLTIETVVTKCRGRLWAFQATASVDGQKVAEAEVLANLTFKSEVA